MQRGSGARRSRSRPPAWPARRRFLDPMPSPRPSSASPYRKMCPGGPSVSDFGHGGAVAGRANLARRSLDTRIGSFVPADGFAKFREIHEQLKVQYLAHRDHLMATAPALKADATERFAQAAREIYPRV